MTQPLADQTVRRLLAAIASQEPAPGAGAAGALSLALGLACALKAVRITSRHHRDHPGLRQADARIEALVEAACRCGDRDATLFEAFIAAMRLPHEGDDERAARSIAIEADAADLVAVGQELIGIGAEARQILRDFEDRLDPVMANDVAAAFALIEANQCIQSRNIAESRSHLA